MDHNLSIRVASVFIIFVASFLGIAFPLYSNAKTTFFRVMNTGSAGVMLGLAMMHLLPDADEILAEAFPEYSWSFALTCAGVVLVLAIEQLVMLYAPSDDSSSNSSGSEMKIRPGHDLSGIEMADCHENCGLASCTHEVRPVMDHDHSHMSSYQSADPFKPFPAFGGGDHEHSHMHKPADHSHDHQHAGCAGHESHGQNDDHSHSHHGHHSATAAGHCCDSHSCEGHSSSARYAVGAIAVASPPGSPTKVGAGIIRQLSHDHAGHDHDHDHGLGNVMQSHSLQKLITAYVLEISIAVHSIIIGVDLGLLSQPGDTVTLISLLVALIFHQFIEGVGLGSAIQASRGSLGDSKVMGFVAIFSLTMPIGILIGIGTSSDDPTESQDIAKGVANSFAAGSLLYISLSEMVADYFSASDLRKRPHLRLMMLASFMFGVFVMAVIANWA